MDSFRNRWTVLLVLASLVALAVEHEVVQFGPIGVHLGVLTIENVRSGHPMILTLGIIVVLVVLLAQHTRSVAPAVRKAFHDGYVSTPSFIEIIKSKVESATGSSRFGAPLGEFRATLCRPNIDCGRFTVEGGKLTGPVVVSIPVDIHVRALKSGFVHACQLGTIFTAYVPVVIAIWAVTELAI